MAQREAERNRRIERSDALCASYGPTALREKLRRLKKRRHELIAQRRWEAEAAELSHLLECQRRVKCWLRCKYGQIGAPATPPGPPPPEPAAPTSGSAETASGSARAAASSSAPAAQLLTETGSSSAPAAPPGPPPVIVITIDD